MTYEDIVKKAKRVIKSIDTSMFKEHTAIEVVIEGEGEGAFYIEYNNVKAVVEPYEYYDNDCRIRTDEKTLLAILDGKIDVAKAFSDGSITIEGDADKAVAFAEALKKSFSKKNNSISKKSAAKGRI